MASTQHSSIPAGTFFLFLGAIAVCSVGYFAGFDEPFFQMLFGIETLGIVVLGWAIFKRTTQNPDSRVPLKFPLRLVVVTLAILLALYLLGTAFLEGLGNAYRF